MAGRWSSTVEPGYDFRRPLSEFLAKDWTSAGSDGTLGFRVTPLIFSTPEEIEA